MTSLYSLLSKKDFHCSTFHYSHRKPPNIHIRETFLKNITWAFDWWESVTVMHLCVDELLFSFKRFCFACVCFKVTFAKTFVLLFWPLAIAAVWWELVLLVARLSPSRITVETKYLNVNVIICSLIGHWALQPWQLSGTRARIHAIQLMGVYANLMDWGGSASVCGCRRGWIQSRPPAVHVQIPLRRFACGHMWHALTCFTPTPVKSRMQPSTWR